MGKVILFMLFPRPDAVKVDRQARRHAKAGGKRRGSGKGKGKGGATLRVASCELLWTSRSDPESGLHTAHSQTHTLILLSNSRCAKGQKCVCVRVCVALCAYSIVGQGNKRQRPLPPQGCASLFNPPQTPSLFRRRLVGAAAQQLTGACMFEKGDVGCERRHYSFPSKTLLPPQKVSIFPRRHCSSLASPLLESAAPLPPIRSPSKSAAGKTRKRESHIRSICKATPLKRLHRYEACAPGRGHLSVSLQDFRNVQTSSHRFSY